MKTKAWVWLVASMLAGGLVLEAAAQDEEPATYCRFVKERKDDFAWENDKIAFRAYGPALRGAPEDSGVEVWLKCVDYPIIDAWYKRSADGYSFQQDHGEGYVPFTAGASRGCGGLALWVDGKMVPSNVFKSNRIEKKTKDESVFVLNYEWRHGGATYTEEKRITIQLGDRVYKASSTFKKNGKPVENLKLAVGLVRQHECAEIDQDLAEGWLSVWESVDGQWLGTGIVMDAARIEETLIHASDQGAADHALILAKTDAEGKIEYYAGYGWEKAGEITSREEWMRYLSSFARSQPSS